MTRGSMRRPSWPRTGSRIRFATPAPQSLDELARRVSENAPDALRRRVDVAYAEPERGGYAPGPGGDRAWRVIESDTLAWCVVDAPSQAALLESVLGGAGSATQTSIERTIVAEAVERLFACAGEQVSRLAECASERPPSCEWWRCNVDLNPRRGRPATLQLFAPPAPLTTSGRMPDHPAETPDLSDVPVSVCVELASVTVPLAAILAWTAGALVPLPRGCLSGATLTVAPGVRVAHGRVGSTLGDAGQAVRAVEIAIPQLGRVA